MDKKTYLNERLAQHLRLPNKNKNATDANMTLEQDVLREFTECRCCYAAVYLLPIRKGTSATYDRGMDEWLRDNNHKFRDVNIITKTFKFDNKSSPVPGSRQVREMNDLNPENPGEALGKPRG